MGADNEHQQVHTEFGQTDSRRILRSDNERVRLSHDEGPISHRQAGVRAGCTSPRLVKVPLGHQCVDDITVTLNPRGRWYCSSVEVSSLQDHRDAALDEVVAC